MQNRPLFALVLAAALGLGLGGCWPGYRPGGQEASRDLFTYESTVDFPQNIVVVDLVTNEQLLTVEVPIGQQLVVRFYDDHDKKNTARPALMRWKLMPRGTEWGELTNSMPVPHYTQRRVDVFIRGQAESVPRPVPAPEPATKN